MANWTTRVTPLPDRLDDREALLKGLGADGWEPFSVENGIAYLKKTLVPTVPTAVSVNNMPVMHAPEGPLTTPSPPSRPLLTVENAMVWTPDTTRGEKRLVSLSSQDSGLASSPHTHRVLVIVCEKGKIIRSIVDAVQGHNHPITVLGMLDEADGHTHTHDPKMLG